MTTYKPTKEELEELGFLYEEDYKQWELDIEKSNSKIYYRGEQELYFYIIVWGEIGYGYNGLYPHSLSDLKTIIKIFTPE